ncbi:hypothetical protein L1887_05020 [Cichorium endivia]|nr:hypothetical protein L1887_05020 [Cichorium endivia]
MGRCGDGADMGAESLINGVVECRMGLFSRFLLYSLSILLLFSLLLAVLHHVFSTDFTASLLFSRLFSSRKNKETTRHKEKTTTRGNGLHVKHEKDRIKKAYGTYDRRQWQQQGSRSPLPFLFP